MERRWGNRLVLDETVRIMRDQEIMGLACLHECSLSGGFLRTRWHIPNLTRVHIELCHEGPCPERMVEAFVVRPSADGAGVEWCEFAPAGITHLMEGRRSRLAMLSREIRQPGRRAVK